MYLSRVDGHAGWASASVLERAGIGADTPDPPGGRIVRDAHGEPTGVLLERANELVGPLLPEFDDGLLRDALAAGAAALAERGIVEAFDAGFLRPPGVVDLTFDLERVVRVLGRLDRETPLPIRLNLMVPAPSAAAERLLRHPALRAVSPRVRVTHLKLFADGALGSRGGALAAPYSDDPRTRGVPRMNSDEILAWSRRAVEAGLDVAVHAIGDAAVRATLEAYARLLAEHTDLVSSRLRIEHVSLAPAQLRERAVALGVVLSIQPNFVAPDDTGATMEDARLGARAADAYAWGSLYEAGAPLAFGSDWFSLPDVALGTVHAASTRANARNRPADGWHPEQRLPRAVALRLAWTLVRPHGAPPRVGRLSPGDPADFVLLSADPFQVSARRLRAVRVLALVRGGEVVWSDGTVEGLAPGTASGGTR